MLTMQSIVKFIAATALALLMPSLCLANPSAALQNYHLGHYLTAQSGLETLAEKNHGEALYYLANIYRQGLEVKKDAPLGQTLMLRSGNANYLTAQMFLGKYYLHQQHDLSNALLWFKKAADQGNAKARLYTALAYKYGYGTKVNADKARRYFIKAAQQGIPMAQYELAKIFMKNRHAVDRRNGVLWLKRAAKNNEPDAALLLGMMLNQGKQMKSNPSAGLKWIKKAVALGNPQAELELKKIQAVTSDTSTAQAEAATTVKPEATTTAAVKTTPAWQLMLNKLKQAHITLKNPKIIVIDNQSIRLTSKLNKLQQADVIATHYDLIKPDSIPLNHVITTIFRSHYQKEQIKLQAPSYQFKMPVGATTLEQSFNKLSRQAQHGHGPAEFKLGQMHANQVHVKQDHQQAFAYFLTSATKGYLKSEYMVGLYYLQGYGVAKDPVKSVAWLTKAALHGSIPAQFLLGTIYQYGIDGIARDVTEAKAMYALASQNGFPLAQYQLAEIYASGISNPNNNAQVEKSNLKLAEKLYRKAAAGGIEEAQVNLAYFEANRAASEQQQEKIFQIVKQAAQSDDPKAMLLLAILYDKGVGTSKSPRRAVKLYQKLAKQNMAIAEFMLGTHYYLADPDSVKAVDLLNKAANQGNVYALYNLGMISKKKMGHDEEFVDYLKKAARLHYKKAARTLADYYLASNVDHTAMADAVKIYTQLAAQQDAVAELKLGFMHEQGIYFKRSSQQALTWYQKSATHGNPVAQYALAMMYQTGNGVKRNIDKAEAYYLASAKQNYSPAIVAMGFINEVDKKDYNSAVEWYKKAIALDNKQAEQNLSLLKKHGKGVLKKPKKRFGFF